MRRLAVASPHAVLLLAVASPHARACFCAPPERVVDGLREADAVFTGTVSGVSGAEATFLVGARFKGEVGRSLVLLQGEPGMCGYTFRAGRSYLIYARTDGAPGRFSTSLCDRTAPLVEAQGDVAQLVLLSTPQRAVSGMPGVALVLLVLLLLLAVAMLLAPRAGRRATQ